MENKKEFPKEKTRLHPRNKNKKRYDFKLLAENSHVLKPFIALNSFDEWSIDFSNPKAVNALNKALLKKHYGINYWEIPPNYLCPPIPGRADYIHYLADLLGETNSGEIPKGITIKCLDVGVGANCIYPIVGVVEYGWSFIGADIDPVAVKSATLITKKNKALQSKIECRLQPNKNDFFFGVLDKREKIDITLCNPPFYNSAKEAEQANSRKLRNLKLPKGVRNFGGQSNELWCEGGELKFISSMIKESKKFGQNCFWFTTLVSKQSNLKKLYKILDGVEAIKVKTIPMGQGQKSSRILAWTFLTKETQFSWSKKYRNSVFSKK